MRKRKLVMMILSLLVAGTGLVFTACSSDNDEPKPDVPQEPSVKLDPDTIQVFEGLTVKFQMLNADSLPVTTFKEGENITFMLVVTNSREEMAAIPSIIDMLGTNTFNIYTAQGEDLGRPWDARIGVGRPLGYMVHLLQDGVRAEAAAQGQLLYPVRDQPQQRR